MSASSIKARQGEGQAKAREEQGEGCHEKAREGQGEGEEGRKGKGKTKGGRGGEKRQGKNKEKEGEVHRSTQVVLKWTPAALGAPVVYASILLFEGGPQDTPREATKEAKNTKELCTQ